jgi:two-component system, NtrC family, sensor kinase
MNTSNAVKDLQSERGVELAERCEQLEQELAQARQQLDVARRLLLDQARLVSVGQLVAGIAHELKNPANFVYGGAVALVEQLGRPGGAAQEKLVKLAQIVQTGAERIRDLTNNLNSFCGKGPRDNDQVDLAEAVRSTAALLEPQLRRCSVELRLDLARGLVVTGNRGELCQVIANLLLNAIQASAAGGCVEVTAEPRDREVGLKVRDHGVGMSPEVAARIFDPFFTTKAPGEGTGLGLTISQSIVERHGGRIEIESKPGEGSLFSLILRTGVQEDGTHG